MDPVRHKNMKAGCPCSLDPPCLITIGYCTNSRCNSHDSDSNIGSNGSNNRLHKVQQNRQWKDTHGEGGGIMPYSSESNRIFLDPKHIEHKDEEENLACHTSSK